MSNPNPNLENLSSYKSKWKSGKTQTIRVPVAIAKQVLKVAHQIDESDSLDIEDTDDNIVPFCDPSNSQEKKSANTSVSSELISKEDALEVLTEGLAIPSNRGGEIKTYLARLGRMLGFEIEKNSKKQWVITDTSK